MTGETNAEGELVQFPKVVSLFSGAGGLDLGFSNTGFPVVFAADSSEWAVRTHKRNFPDTTSIVADLVELGPKGVSHHLRGLLKPGASIGVIGGPPCQGFSRANTTSTAEDPRNSLALLYLKIVEMLQSEYNVEFVLFENVQGIRDAKHSVVFDGLLSRFSELGFHTGVQDCVALDFGVAQARSRVIIFGFSASDAADRFAPATVRRKNLTVKSVIGGLPQPAFYSRGLTPDEVPHHPNHWTMRPLSKRFTHPDGVQNRGRSFRRLAWDQPSPTVAYGHREIHVHPNGKRRLSVYEAMLLQGFPEDFVLEGTLSAQIDQVSNAVPPPLARALADATKRAIGLDDLGASRGNARIMQGDVPCAQ